MGGRTGELSISILSANLAYRPSEPVKSVEARADPIREDVMDVHFVPTRRLGAVVVASMRRHTGVALADPAAGSGSIAKGGG